MPFSIGNARKTHFLANGDAGAPECGSIEIHKPRRGTMSHNKAGLRACAHSLKRVDHSHRKPA
jgi:hypothetical protein